ncbi:MAG TPA: hypothetical protein VD932_02690 [Aquabacterium sp.]|nr:hypothetical protein [Aquabacterium sp.]
MAARRSDLLPRTLESLRVAGFPSPRLFVDGGIPASALYRDLGLPTTVRDQVCRAVPDRPRVRAHGHAFGNWLLGALELLVREPQADRYAIFQDDVIACRNLREYLERSTYPDHGYLNLYTVKLNERFKPRDQSKGWFVTSQRGLGAVALVFSRDALLGVFSNDHLVRRLIDLKRGPQAIDGGVVEAAKKAGWREYCHWPSLVQHIGTRSAIGNNLANPDPEKNFATAPSFPGEDHDALSYLP